MIFFIVYGCKPAAQNYEHTVGAPAIPVEEAVSEQDTAGEPLLQYPELLMEESEGYVEWVEEAEEVGWAYLMAFHTCDTAIECGNPMNHTVRIAALKMVMIGNFARFPLAGSVPDLLYRDGVLYLYAMHFVYRYDFNEGLGPSEVVSVENPDGTPDRHVDPNPLLTDDGRIVLLYLSNDPNGDPAGCTAFPCFKSFKMAVEKRDGDGAAF